MGLSAVYGIVQQHRGWLEIESTQNQGTVCRVLPPAEHRPIRAQELPLDDTSIPAACFPRRLTTILLVEDEESLRELVSATLTEAGYAVIAAVSGLEALALWELHGESIDLLFTDMVMP